MSNGKITKTREREKDAGNEWDRVSKRDPEC